MRLAFAYRWMELDFKWFQDYTRNKSLDTSAAIRTRKTKNDQAVYVFIMGTAVHPLGQARHIPVDGGLRQGPNTLHPRFHPTQQHPEAMLDTFVGCSGLRTDKAHHVTYWG